MSAVRTNPYAGVKDYISQAVAKEIRDSVRDELEQGQRIVTCDERSLARVLLEEDVLCREATDSEIDLILVGMREAVRQHGAALGLTCVSSGFRYEGP